MARLVSTRAKNSINQSHQLLTASTRILHTERETSLLLMLVQACRIDCYAYIAKIVVNIFKYLCASKNILQDFALQKRLSRHTQTLPTNLLNANNYTKTQLRSFCQLGREWNSTVQNFTQSLRKKLKNYRKI